MKKLYALFSAGVAIAVMTGCGLDPVGTPVIEIDKIDTITIPGAGSIERPVKGKVEADTAITAISYEIRDNGDQPANGISVIGPAANYEEKLDFDDNPIRIIVSSTAVEGSYKLRISVTAGPSIDATFNFYVKGGSGGAVSEKTDISMGASGAIPPSLLEADNMITFSSTLADEATRRQIDVIFDFSTVLDPDALAFISPDVAQGAPYDSWTNKAHAEFKVVSATWSSITTQADIDALWGTGTGSSRLPISQGDIIIILTNNQVYKAVQIVSITGTGSSATITINGKY